MIIQFNFENNTQIPSVKVCVHIFGGSCMSQRLDERFIGTGRSLTVSLEGGDSKNGFSAHKMFC
jgi:hypothetical protein